jgi:hypothetical protein
MLSRLSRLIRQLVFGVSLAVLVGPIHGSGGKRTLALLIIAVATIPTSMHLLNAFSGKALGVVAMILFGGMIALVALWIVDPIYRLGLGLSSRLAVFASVTVILFLSGWLKMRRTAASQERVMSWRPWLFLRPPDARGASRFPQVYLRTATDVTPEEEFIADLYARGGGDSVFVRKGWAGRRAAARAAIWVGEMEMWLRQNPTATREEQLAQSRKLLDKRRLTAKW